MPLPNVQTAVAENYRHQEIKAVLVKACPNCGAPGVFKVKDAWFMQWPEICVDDTDPQVNQPVGDICPHCEAERDEQLTEDLGTIWEFWLFGSKFQELKFKVKSRVKSFFKGIFQCK